MQTNDGEITYIDKQRSTFSLLLRGTRFYKWGQRAKENSQSPLKFYI